MVGQQLPTDAEDWRLAAVSLGGGRPRQFSRRALEGELRRRSKATAAASWYAGCGWHCTAPFSGLWSLATLQFLRLRERLSYFAGHPNSQVLRKQALFLSLAVTCYCLAAHLLRSVICATKDSLPVVAFALSTLQTVSERPDLIITRPTTHFARPASTASRRSLLHLFLPISSTH